MACCGFKMVLLQTIAIGAIGLGAGLADSIRRPLKFGGRQTSELPFDGSPTNSAKPEDHTPAPPPPNANSFPKPGDPGWTPTPKAAMPKGQITLEEAKRLFDSGAAFVDARRKEDYEAGHVKGALRLNLKSFENGDPPLLAMIPRDNYVVVYCSGGNCDESEHVAEFMSNSGYSKVYVIHDGFPGWKSVGYPNEPGEGIQ